MAGGVYTVARTAIHDALTLALAVLAAGALGWLLTR
jgi:hypothetical protein